MKKKKEGSNLKIKENRPYDIPIVAILLVGLTALLVYSSIEPDITGMESYAGADLVPQITFTPANGIQAMSYSPQQLNMLLTIKNTGYYPSSQSIVRFSMPSKTYDFYIPPLQPGYSYYISLTTWLYPGSYSFSATADVLGWVPERDETNNYVLQNYGINMQQQAKPDLTPAEIRYTGNLTEGNPIFFSSAIINSGQADSSVFNVRWTVDGEEAYFGQYPGIKANALLSAVGAEITRSLSPGQHSIKFSADPDNKVAETNEANNEKEINVTVTKITDSFYGQNLTLLHIFGQRALGETARNRVTPFGIDHAAGILVDRSSRPNKVYVADSGNNRILGYNGVGFCAGSSIACTTDNDCTASSCTVDGKKAPDIVFGQDNFEGSSCNKDNNIGINGNPGADTLCLIGFPYVTNVAEFWMRINFDVDSEGNLYIPDTWNNRILKYNQPFSTSKIGGKGDTVADIVIGQPNFSTNGFNKGASALYKMSDELVNLPSYDSLWLSSGPPDGVSSRGVSVDSAGDVWVADTFNERVLRFRKGSTTADLVIGQSSFNERQNSCSVPNPRDAPLDKLCSPTLARIEPSTGELYVTDEHPKEFKARILVYRPPFANGTPADRVIIPSISEKIINGYTGRPAVFQSTGFIFNSYKNGDYSQGVLWTHDGTGTIAGRTLLLAADGSIIKIINSPTEDLAGGEQNYPNECGKNAWEGFNLLAPGGQIGFDEANNIYLADERTHRISRYALPYETRVVGEKTCLPEPNGGLFPGTEPNVADDSRMDSGVGLAVYGNQLIVRDGQGLKVWNAYTTKEIGAKPDLTVYDTSGSSFWGRLMISEAIDDSGRLWLINNWGGIKIYQLPLKGNDQPLGDYVELYWADNGEKVSRGPGNIAFDKVSKALYIMDASNSRILRVTNYNNFKDKLYVDMVIGQPDKTTTKCNHNQEIINRIASGEPSADSLCMPYQIKFDKFGNLYVLDNNYECQGNDRITTFLAGDIKNAQGTLFPNLQAKKAFVGTLTSKGLCGYNIVDSLGSPVSMAFNSKNQMVVGGDGYYGDPKLRHTRQLWVYRNPLEKQTPDDYIGLPLGAAGEIAYDSQDNLIVQDHTWNKIWVVNPDTVDFEFTINPGSLSINSYPGRANVYVDNIYRGITPEGITEGENTRLIISRLGKGTHSLYLTKEGYVDHVGSVNVVGGKISAYSASLFLNDTAQITITSTPSSARTNFQGGIFTTGLDIGYTPIKIPIFEKGQYTIKIYKPGYTPYPHTTTVTVDQLGKEYFVNAILIKS